MVKGISRQVILVKSPDPELFEQAIFILKDSAVRQGVTDEMLLKEARQAIGRQKNRHPGLYFICMLLGAGAAGLICWLTFLI